MVIESTLTPSKHRLSALRLQLLGCLLEFDMLETPSEVWLECTWSGVAWLPLEFELLEGDFMRILWLPLRVKEGGKLP